MPKLGWQVIRLLLCLAVGLPIASRAQTPPDEISHEAQLVLYAVRVNHQEVVGTRFLRLPGGSLLARLVDLQEWRLRLPATTPVNYLGEEFILLDQFKEISYQVNEAQQLLELEFIPQSFNPTLISTSVKGANALPVLPNWGGYANYDLLGNRTASQSGQYSWLDGAFDMTLFGPLGSGTSSFLGQNLLHNTNGYQNERRIIRLDSTWTRDWPEQTMTLQIGDSTGKSGLWGRPVRMGGIRWGRNFATQPGFVSYPLPAIAGESVLPSTVELYINGALRQSRELPPGPFQITDLPVVTGRGEARLVVRDMLGREQVITQPYYASSALLREGLSDTSYEAGFVRKNYGLNSDQYGRFVTVVTLRQGLSDRVTGEFRAEIFQDQQTAGLGGSVLLPLGGIATAALAHSRSSLCTGELLQLGVENQVQQGISFGVRGQLADEQFTQLGLQPGEFSPRRQLSAHAGLPLENRSSVGLSYTRQDNSGQPPSEIVAANYSHKLAASLFLNVSALSNLNGERSKILSIMLSMPLGEREMVTANTSVQRDANQAQLQYQKSLPPGSGMGYRLLADGGDLGEREEAGITLQTDVGTYGLEAGHLPQQSNYRVNINGGLALLDKRAFFTRRIADSFAVAQVPGFANINLYTNSQLVARTDAEGYAVIPTLGSYQFNQVNIDAAELPMDAQIETTQISAAPYYRSGLSLKFSVKLAHGALLSLTLDDGEPMPIGAVVRIVGQAEEFPVGMRGEVYVTDLEESNQLQAIWNNQTCSFSLVVPPNSGAAPRFGPIRCSGVPAIPVVRQK